MNDPEPYLAVRRAGRQITGAREEHRNKTRDTQRWKEFKFADTVLQSLEDTPATVDKLNIGAGLSYTERPT